ncbi:MAG: hypothetical protein FWD03_02015 [Defluviitaleaceae bacterium]|nr:hypothetical protein [Defluviitaleaceae bacterium]
MQSILLSQNQLDKLMRLLKDALASFDRHCSHNLAFINDWCLYRHIREYNVPRIPGRRLKYTTVGMLLDILEPYIPYRLTDENYGLFMDAAHSPEEADPKFAHKAKLDFVVTLRAIKHPVQWEQAFEVCETIRAIKEELILATS